MATTVRQVKRLGRRSASSNKLVSAPCWNMLPQFGGWFVYSIWIMDVNNVRNLLMVI